MAEINSDQFADKTKKRLDMLLRNVGLSLFNSVIRDSPVGNPDLWKSQAKKDLKKRRGPAGYVGGRFRANWNCSLNSANTSTTEETSASRSKQSVEEGTGKATRDDALFLSNGLPYAYRLEYEGHSSQAPQGMVRRNAARGARIVSAELRKLKG